MSLDTNEKGALLPGWAIHGFMKAAGFIIAILGLYVFYRIESFVGFLMIIGGILFFLYSFSFYYSDQAEFLRSRGYLQQDSRTHCGFCGADLPPETDTCWNCRRPA